QEVLAVSARCGGAYERRLGGLLSGEARRGQRGDLALSCGQLRSWFTCPRRRPLGRLDWEVGPEGSRPAFELTEVPRRLRPPPVGKDPAELRLGSIAVAHVRPEKELGSPAPCHGFCHWQKRVVEEGGALPKELDRSVEVL